jgi:hypothetical protein
VPTGSACDLFRRLLAWSSACIPAAIPVVLGLAGWLWDGPDVQAQALPLEVDWRLRGAWPGYPRGSGSVRVDGQYAYVAAGAGGLAIFDLSDPARPRMVGHYSPAMPWRLATGETEPAQGDRLPANQLSDFSVAEKSGSFVYVVSDYNGIDVIDVADPENPRRVGGYRGEPDAYFTDLQISGDHAYVLDYSLGLSVLDVRNPRRIFRSGRLAYAWADGTNFLGGNSLAVSNGLVMVAAGDKGLAVIDANPTQPMLLAFKRYSAFTHWSVAAAGSSAVQVVQSDNPHGVLVYDLSNPASPRPSQYFTFDFPWLPTLVRGHNDVFLFAGDGMALYRLPADGDPQNLGSYPSPDLPNPPWILSADFTDRLACVLSFDQGLQIVDITKPGVLPLLGSIDLSGDALDVASAGNRAVLADNTGGLRVVDVSDPAAPKLTSTLRTGYFSPRLVRAMESNRGVAADLHEVRTFDMEATNNLPRVFSTTNLIAGIDGQAGRLLVVGTSKGLQQGRFDVLDLAGTNAAVVRGTCALPDLMGYSVRIAGNLALVGGITNGLHVIDVEDPDAPKVIGHHVPANRTPGAIPLIADIAVAGQTAYLALGRDGLEVVDLADPTRPIAIRRVPLSGIAAQLHLSDGRLCVSCMDWGIKILDVTVPNHPALLDEIGTRGQARAAVRSGQHLLVANGPYGLAVLEAESAASRPPRILSPPESILAEPGATVRLEAVAAGVGPLSYRWRKNGQDLAETNQVLEIAALSAEAAGSYTVVVTGPGGQTESRPAWVALQTPAPLVSFSDSYPAPVVATNASGRGSTNNLHATLQPGEPRHARKLGGRSLWLQWQAPDDGIATFRTLGSGFDTLLAAYQGDLLTNLTELAANDDDATGFLTSEIRFNARAGARYHLAVAGYGLLGSALDVQFQGTRAYVVGSGQSLAIYDVRDPLAPVPEGVLSADWSGTRLEVIGHYVYVAAGEAGLRVVDVSQSGVPVEVTAYVPPGGTVSGVQVDATRAFLAAGAAGVQLLDISNPLAPALLGVWKGASPVRAVDFTGDLACVVEADEIVTVDWSSPGQPRALGRYGTGGNDIRMVGQHAFVATGTGLDILDVSDPETPVQTGSYTGSLVPALAIEVVSSTAYLALGDHGVEVIDVQDLAQPALSWHPPGVGYCHTVRSVGQVLYLANGEEGLAILDGSQPDRPVQFAGFRGGHGPVLLDWTLQPTQDRLPTITMQPPSATLAGLGRPLRLAVTAAPEGCHYQWFQHGQPLAGEIGTNLYRATAQPRDAGTYFVRITSPDGRDLDSHPAVVEVVDPPGLGRGTVDKFADLFDASTIAWTNLPAALASRPGSLMSSGHFTLYGDLRGSRRQPGEPTSCAPGTGASRWYYFQAPVGGFYRFDTSASATKTLVAVFTNRMALTLAACHSWSAADPDVKVTLRLDARQEAFVMVDGVGGDAGPFQIKVPETTVLLPRPVDWQIDADRRLVVTYPTTGSSAVDWEIHVLDQIGTGVPTVRVVHPNTWPNWQFRDPEPANARSRFFFITLPETTNP